MKKKREKEPFVFTKGSVIVIVGVLVLALVAPSAVYAFELHSLKKEQAQLTETLQETVKADVKTYIKEATTYAADGNDTESVAISGFITKGNSDSSEDIAEAVAAILTDDYISSIKADVLNDMYSRIDAIIAEKYANDGTVDTSQLSDAVSAIVTQNLQSYKQEVMNSVSELDNFYSKVNDLTNTTDSKITTLQTEVALLDSTYANRFAALEEKDMNLQSQIDSMKTTYTALRGEYATLNSKLSGNSTSISQLKTELASRIDTLKANTENQDTAIINALVDAQNQLNRTITTEDSKIYSNAVRLIELTDKITGIDATLSSSIDVLKAQTGTDTQELYDSLLLLEYNLSQSNADLSDSYNSERAERLAQINDLIAAIDTLTNDTSANTDELRLSIERKSRQLADDLELTSAELKTEYTALISNTSSSLKDYVDEVAVSLDSKIDEKGSELDSKIDDTNTNLNSKIDSSNETLDNKIDSTESTLNNTIDSVKSFLSGKIDSSNEELNNKIDASQLETMEEMSAAIESLQKQIEELQAQIDDLEDKKLNITDSTTYNYTTAGGNTIKITVPETNPNYIR